MKAQTGRSGPGLFVRIFAPPGAATDGLRRAVLAKGAEVAVDWPLPEPLPVSGDLVFVVPSPDLAGRIPWTPGEAPVALVALLSPGLVVDTERLRLVGFDAVLAHPAPPEIVAATMAVARDRFLYERRLRQRIEKLEETLRAVRTVERAKAVLMAERNLSEDEAYSLLRKRAMERRMSLGALAEALLDTHELFRTSSTR